MTFLNPDDTKRTPLILVADDSFMERSVMKDFLAAEGYQVLEAGDGTSAVEVYERLRPDLVLMDYIMPVMDGIEACRRIRDSRAGVEASVIMVSAISDDETVETAYGAGAVDFIAKPVVYPILKQRIARTLAAQSVRKELEQNTAFSNSIITHVSEAIITTDSVGIIRYVNPMVCRMFGYEEAELLGEKLRRVLPEVDPETETVRLGESDTRSVEGVDREGGTVPLEMSVSRFRMDDRWYYTLTLQDVTARKQYEEQIRYQALYDALTGLPNRVFLKERMAFEIARARRSGAKFAVLYLDLDRFKLINDTLGHGIGDALLQQMAVRLKNAIRADDMVVRMGGDEFVIMLPGLFNVDLVGKIARKILDVVKEPIEIEGNRLNLTISIGIAIYPDDANDYEVLLTYADIAMYQAKEKGKDNFQAFTPELNARALERLDMENGLREALEREEFILYYQAKVDTKTLRIVGMEALVRWRHPKLGLVPPGTFIAIAEESGLIVPLGTWVLRKACEANQSLVKEGLPPLTVAVNLSMRQFEAENLAEVVREILKETGMAPWHLELEITESIAMKDAEYTIAVIRGLQELGVLFSIDDFGTGYSSLSHINRLSADKLKIDKSFVSPINEQNENTIIASTVLSLGKNLRMQVIAEGVETQAQVDFLTAHDCDELQGYFIARPMPWEDFRRLYQQNLAGHGGQTVRIHEGR